MLSFSKVKKENSGKKYHIRQIAEYYGVETGECLLFDHDLKNVSDTDDLFEVIQVGAKCGFDLRNLPAINTGEPHWICR